MLTRVRDFLFRWWKWLAGGLGALLGILAFWRWRKPEDLRPRGAVQIEPGEDITPISVEAGKKAKADLEASTAEQLAKIAKENEARKKAAIDIINSAKKVKR